jgi:tetratricopeptide (TPR) repeat protein
LRVFAFCGLATLHFAAGADALTDQARALLDGGRAKEAYAILLPLEPARAGDIQFDYLLGIAALDSGDPERAVFALERVLAMKPDYAQARAEIARAYIALGDREGARRELETVKAAAPPPEVQATIDRFLAAISKPPAHIAGFIEGTFGVDSNINAATGSGSLAIPAIGTVTLGPGLTRLSDSFLGLAAGGNVSYPINENWTFVGGLRGNMRLNGSDSTKTQFDTTTADMDAAVRWDKGLQDSVTLGVQGQTFLLDNNRYRNATGVIAQWQRNLSATQQVSLFGQRTDLRYETQSIRNANRTIAGAAYAQSFGIAYSPVLFVSGYLGSERELAPGVPNLGHNPIGARLGVQLTLQPERLFFNAFIGYEARRYGGPEPLFGFNRRDNQADVRAALTWKLADGWSVTPQVAYTDNRSNVNLFKYDRTITSVAMRKDF